MNNIHLSEIKLNFYLNIKLMESFISSSYSVLQSKKNKFVIKIYKPTKKIKNLWWTWNFYVKSISENQKLLIWHTFSLFNLKKLISSFTPFVVVSF